MEAAGEAAKQLGAYVQTLDEQVQQGVAELDTLHQGLVGIKGSAEIHADALIEGVATARGQMSELVEAASSQFEGARTFLAELNERFDTLEALVEARGLDTRGRTEACEENLGESEGQLSAGLETLGSQSEEDSGKVDARKEAFEASFEESQSKAEEATKTLDEARQGVDGSAESYESDLSDSVDGVSASFGLLAAAFNERALVVGERLLGRDEVSQALSEAQFLRESMAKVTDVGGLLNEALAQVESLAGEDGMKALDDVNEVLEKVQGILDLVEQIRPVLDLVEKLLG